MKEKLIVELSEVQYLAWEAPGFLDKPLGRRENQSTGLVQNVYHGDPYLPSTQHAEILFSSRNQQIKVKTSERLTD